MQIALANILLGLLPVVLFLSALVYLDSFKLVRVRTLLTVLAVGACSAFLAGLINTWALDTFHMPYALHTRYVGPPVEEILKSLPLLFFFRRHRIGFMVDAMILGFALGAGFALVENMFYLATRSEAALVLWVIRGFGTAMMHGGTTAIVAMLFKRWVDSTGNAKFRFFLPGLVFGVILHSTFNHFFLAPTITTIIILVVLPLMVGLVYLESERFTRSWLGSGFDTDRDMLEMITTGDLADTTVGRYLQSLQEFFDGAVVGDMLCYLRLYLELSIRAKGVMLMREAGFDVPTDPEARGSLEELRYLERAIGRTGMRAISPCLRRTSRDLWQLSMLEN
jgi:protease PrsW